MTKSFGFISLVNTKNELIQKSFMRVPYIAVDTNAKSSPQSFENVNSILLRKTEY